MTDTDKEPRVAVVVTPDGVVSVAMIGADYETRAKAIRLYEVVSEDVRRFDHAVVQRLAASGGKCAGTRDI